MLVLNRHPAASARSKGGVPILSVFSKSSVGEGHFEPPRVFGLGVSISPTCALGAVPCCGDPDVGLASKIRCLSVYEPAASRREVESLSLRRSFGPSCARAEPGPAASIIQSRSPAIQINHKRALLWVCAYCFLLFLYSRVSVFSFLCLGVNCFASPTTGDPWSNPVACPLHPLISCASSRRTWRCRRPGLV